MKTIEVKKNSNLTESVEKKSGLKIMYQNWLKEKGIKEKSYEVPYLIAGGLYNKMKVVAYAIGGKDFSVEDYMDMVLEDHLKKFGDQIENADSDNE